LFDVRLEPGLAQVLAGRCSLDEAIVAGRATGVDVLAAGKPWASTHRLLTPEAVRRLLDEARGRYGYVILDTPPLLAASETLVLAKAAEACLMCALYGTSRNSELRKACERLEGVGGRAAGIVLSGVTPSVRADCYRGEACTQRGNEVLCRS
jgi:Mrp family chromosome partitioning ATPase